MRWRPERGDRQTIESWRNRWVRVSAGVRWR